MNLARRVFRFAGIYGLLVLVPQYFTEVKLGIDYPPAITHPEFYYGFLGVSISWQIAFLFVATDPLRYRPIMIPSILEKATFSIAVILLFLGHRTSGMMLGFALIDLMLGVAFVVAFVRTSSPQAAQAEGLTVRR
jgi:hypothetical protein